MIKILFICHGNICRSPMAEFVMKDLVKKAGRIESAAVSAEELGNPVYPPARRELAAHGISCDGKTARQMTRADYDRFDFLVCMDQSNLRRMERICGGDSARKMSLLLSHADRSDDVADPWYTGDFSATWRDVLAGCAALLEKIG